MGIKQKETFNIESKGILTDECNRNVITGIDEHLYSRLKRSIKEAKSIDIIVSFLMVSGVRLILNDLKEAVSRGVKIRILTGNYLNITEPAALYLIRGEFGDEVDLRLYNVTNKSFHPKSYIFHNDDNSEIYVGSSNISYGALTSSVEWNYRFDKNGNEEDFNAFYREFENLFLNHSTIVDDEVLKEYSKVWKKPKIIKEIEEKSEENPNVTELIQPKGAQIEALYELQNSRNDGLDKGIVVAATGIGKTYLAAFDSFNYKKVLFVAHREEIIKQAAESFKSVRKSDDVGFFYGGEKHRDKSLIFALVQTLGKDEYLNEEVFPKDYFDYVVVDEFHHAVSSQYKKIIEYFTPKFLLGLTATPERLDSKDVFALCDYNLVYEVRLKEAIEKGWLVPFRYYGVYDETVDYDNIDYKNGKYDDNQLNEKVMVEARADLILKHYSKYSSKRAMGFCASKKHAEYMAQYFTEHGVKAIAVYSGEMGEYSEERNRAISMLTKGEVQVIFSVDMFNEGLDIKDIDMVMFLRPTASPTVFLQQLGRGLRKSKGKEYLNVLDFIGNYKKADLIPFLLAGKAYSKVDVKIKKLDEYNYPEDCIVDFDFRLVDIFKKLVEREMSIKDKIKEEYYRVKEIVGVRPSRIDFFTLMDDDIYDNIKSKSTLNPFTNYFEFLKELNELTQDEEGLYNTRAREFINMIETTSMSKTYKVPLLKAFYNKGDIKLNITEDDVYESFEEFYKNGSNIIDIKNDKDKKNLASWGKKEWIKLAVKNPVKFMLTTHGDFVKERENYVLGLSEDLEEFFENESFKMHMNDAIELRLKTYYKNRMIK